MKRPRNQVSRARRSDRLRAARFAFTEDAIAAIPEDLLLEVAKDDPDGDTNLDNVIIYLEHLSRHLGMIESIRGLQGLEGSATG
jgi:hypothetical protein